MVFYKLNINLANEDKKVEKEDNKAVGRSF